MRSIVMNLSGVCPFVRLHNSKTTRPNFTMFFLHVAYGHVSVLFNKCLFCLQIWIRTRFESRTERTFYWIWIPIRSECMGKSNIPLNLNYNTGRIFSGQTVWCMSVRLFHFFFPALVRFDSANVHCARFVHYKEDIPASLSVCPYIVKIVQ